MRPEGKPRDYEAYLWDIHQSGMDILQLTQGLSFDTYTADRNLRRVVERNFEIVGEALNQARQYYPDQLTGISDVRDIVAFRNRLAHGYFAVDNGIVWGLIASSLPLLIAEVSVLLDEWHGN